MVRSPYDAVREQMPYERRGIRTPGPRKRKAHLSSFDVRSGGVPPLHSAEFGCPPSQLLRTFEFLVRAEMEGRDENKDRCAADVWRGVERGANEGLCGQPAVRGRKVPVGFCR